MGWLSVHGLPYLTCRATLFTGVCEEAAQTLAAEYASSRPLRIPMRCEVARLPFRVRRGTPAKREVPEPAPPLDGSISRADSACGPDLACRRGHRLR